MPRFSANLEYLFAEWPFLERFETAARVGFRAVEYPYPYANDKKKLSGLLSANRLEQVLINSPKGNPEKGEKGFACLTGRTAEFRESIALALEYAVALRCPCVHVMAGMAPENGDRDLAHKALVESACYAAEAFAAHGIKALFEPINEKDNPGYFLTDLSAALQVIRDAQTPNLYLQFDVYHMQITEPNLAVSIEGALPYVAHIQIADNPGRHEPGTGEINFPLLFDLLDRLGYKGWVGCEYVPKEDTIQGLAWIKDYLS
jgi:hydroxypyruvate isomerase